MCRGSIALRLFGIHNPPVIGLLALIAVGAPPVELEVYPDTARIELEGGRAEEGGAPLPAPLELRVVRDETVAVQVRVRARGGGPQEVSLWIDPRARLSPRVFVESGVRVKEASRSSRIHSLGPGLYPDVLLPLALNATLAVPAPPGVAVLFVELYAERQAEPGRFHATLDVGPPSNPARIDLAVRILPLALPSGDQVHLGAMNFGSLMEREKRDPARLRSWMQLAHAHRLNLELMLPLPAIEDGVIDWERWAGRVGPYLDGRAFTATAGYAGPLAGQPVASFILPHNERWPVPPRADAPVPSDPARWSASLSAFEALAERKGWLSGSNPTAFVLFVNKLDEPHDARTLLAIEAYAPLVAAARLRDRRHVRFRVDGPFGQRIPGWSDARILEELGPLVDLWNVCGGTESAPAELLGPRPRNAGLMFYASNTAGEPATPPLVLDSALAGARAWGWIVARYQLSGALNWEVDFRPGCLADPFCSGSPLNLDALLIYRGEEVGRAFDEPIASLRLKALRRGAEDAELLGVLARRDPAAAAAIIRRIVPRALGDRTAGLSRGLWPIEGRAYDRARDRILDRLLVSDTPPITAHELDGIRPDPERWMSRPALRALVAAACLLVFVAAVVHALRARRAL
jgi:hypothetical protein